MKYPHLVIIQNILRSESAVEILDESFRRMLDTADYEIMVSDLCGDKNG